MTIVLERDDLDEGMVCPFPKDVSDVCLYSLECEDVGFVECFLQDTRLPTYGTHDPPTACGFLHRVMPGGPNRPDDETSS